MVLEVSVGKWVGGCLPSAVAESRIFRSGFERSMGEKRRVPIASVMTSCCALSRSSSAVWPASFVVFMNSSIVGVGSVGLLMVDRV